MILKNISAILFDSGKVLNGPKTGHWFMGPRFFEYVNRETFDKIDSSIINQAFTRAGAYINSIHLIETMNEECDYFKHYYTIFSDVLPELKLSEDKVKGLAEDLVFNPSKYVFYEDALKVIPLLSKKYPLAIVSDAWPSLKMVFEEAKMKSYFSSFVISSKIGVIKPDKLMYQTALNELGVNPNQAVFIDDNLRNCLGAKALGIQAILLCRDQEQYQLEKMKSAGKGYEVIFSLNELL